VIRIAKQKKHYTSSSIFAFSFLEISKVLALLFVLKKVGYQGGINYCLVEQTCDRLSLSQVITS